MPLCDVHRAVAKGGTKRQVKHMVKSPMKKMQSHHVSSDIWIWVFRFIVVQVILNVLFVFASGKTLPDDQKKKKKSGNKKIVLL